VCVCVCVYQKGDKGYDRFRNIGTGPYFFKPEDGGSLFLRNTGVKYIHIGYHSAEDYTLANPRRETFKYDTFTVCLLSAIVLRVKCVYICTEIRLSTRGN
jgi:hypothetical protein